MAIPILHRNSLAILLPALIIVLGLLVANKQLGLPEFIYASKAYLPWFFIVPAIVLSLAFRLSREFNLLLILSVLFWAEQQFLWQNSYQLNYNKRLLYPLLAILIAFNLILQNAYTERGNFSLPGLKRLGITFLQFVVLALLLWSNWRGLNSMMDFNLFGFLWPDKSVLPGLANSLFVIAAGTMAYRIYHNPSLLNIAQPAVLVAAFLMLHYQRHSMTSTLFISITAAILLIAVLLNSYSLAYIDELTGLPSRRALKQAMMSVGQRYCLAMLDIDHFKKLNDTYGHDVGDQVLRMVASRIRRCPGCSKSFRYGGEEFTIVFNGKDLNEARNLAQAVVKSVADTPFSIRGKRRPRKKPGFSFITKQPPPQLIDVTISIGIAEKRNAHPTPQEVLKDADKALYRAKEKGRNRVCT